MLCDAALTFRGTQEEIKHTFPKSNSDKSLEESRYKDLQARSRFSEAISHVRLKTANFGILLFLPSALLNLDGEHMSQSASTARLQRLAVRTYCAAVILHSACVYSCTYLCVYLTQHLSHTSECR